MGNLFQPGSGRRLLNGVLFAILLAAVLVLISEARAGAFQLYLPDHCTSPTWAEWLLYGCYW
jgi:hypothetical protein